MIEEIALRCGRAKKTSSGWQCCCPAHEDRSPSLSLAESDNKILYHCKAGCSQDAVRNALESLGFHLNGNLSPMRETKVYYTYNDENGNPIHRKEKWLPSKKMFIQHFLNGEWHYKLGPNQPILYKLKELREAIQLGKSVAICEGEKDADRVQKELGIVCTCNISGAIQGEKQWPKSFTQEFQNANVNIFFDNDEPGIRHKNYLINELKNVAFRLNVIHLAEFQKDVSDHFDSGFKKQDLRAEGIPLPESLMLDASDWLENKRYEIEPLIDGLFDRGDKVVIIGKSKTRKSFFALQLLLACVTSRPFLGFDIPKARKALLIQYEIKDAHFHGRLERMCDAMGILPSDLKHKLSIINARGKDLDKTQVIKYIKESGAEVVLFDPLYKLMEGAENAVEDFKPILKWFDEIAEATKAAILYVHHDKKGFVGEQDTADRGAGSSILGRDFDASFYLTPHEDKSLVVLQALTRNYAPKEDVSVQWVNGCFQQSDLPVRIRTSKSPPQNKLKLEDWLGPALELFKPSLDPIPVKEFIQKLRDLGASKDMSYAVIENLVSLGKIMLESRKKEKNRASRFVIPVTN